MVFSLAPRHFLLVIYGGIYEWVAEKSHREQPVVTETAVVELRELRCMTSNKFFLFYF